MTVLQRIQREPAKLLALVTALGAVLALLGVPVTPESVAAALALVAALVAVLSYFVTPSSEGLVQAKPDGHDQVKGVAGPAAAQPTGEPVDVVVRKAP